MAEPTTDDDLDRLLDSWLIEAGDVPTKSQPEPARLPVATATALRREIRQIFESEEAKMRTTMRCIMDEELKRFRVVFERQLTTAMTSAAIQAARATKRLVAAEMRVAEAARLSPPDQSAEL
jgi:hypothetical protein